MGCIGAYIFFVLRTFQIETFNWQNKQKLIEEKRETAALIINFLIDAFFDFFVVFVKCKKYLFFRFNCLMKLKK